MDGTEWKIGSFELHVLVLAAQLNGVAVPVYFKVYEHKGVLSEQERINFIRKALAIIDLKHKLLVADREFIGKEWLGFLVLLEVNFIIRLRKKMYKTQIESAGHRYEKLEKRALKKGYSEAIFEINGTYYKIEMWKSSIPNEPIIYLITSILTKKKIGKQYAKRWKIEYCFKHLKTNGFNLEEMSLTDLKKIRLMIALVVVAYILAIREGIIQQNKQPVRLIKYKNGDVFSAVSIFRIGLQEIGNQVFNARNLVKYLSKFKPRLTPQIKIV